MTVWQKLNSYDGMTENKQLWQKIKFYFAVCCTV